jgi:hypothetical protein
MTLFGNLPGVDSKENGASALTGKTDATKKQPTTIANHREILIAAASEKQPATSTHFITDDFHISIFLLPPTRLTTQKKLFF